jgi:type I restriction enzyme S subunit
VFSEEDLRPLGCIPLLSSKQFFQVDPIDVKRLAKGAHMKDMKEIALEENMILVTRSGTIGRVQIVPSYMEGWAGSEHAIRLIAAEKMHPGYLFTWLDSAYGYELVTRHTYGSVINEIDNDMLGSVPVPELNPSEQDYVGSPVLQAKQCWDEAWQLEQEAIGKLDELGSDNPLG